MEEPDEAYKDLVQNEMFFIRKNQDKIRANAQLIYKQKWSTIPRQGMLCRD